ncbi:hypothetical protein ml_268 [Mollivirus sibericum]|uniref:hypothetical protein n=1 Tax=Mollivirus sibericum TaxID=1678078 RepID=UPI0006B2E6B9|nr:hypothetical protein ml_268 [Mollivirus sibericum]ALD62070.1 hypothetical protein ml_268 [Mollivirus sibericum]
MTTLAALDAGSTNNNANDSQVSLDLLWDMLFNEEESADDSSDQSWCESASSSAASTPIFLDGNSITASSASGSDSDYSPPRSSHKRRNAEGVHAARKRVTRSQAHEPGSATLQSECKGLDLNLPMSDPPKGSVHATRKRVVLSQPRESGTATLQSECKGLDLNSPGPEPPTEIVVHSMLPSDAQVSLANSQDQQRQQSSRGVQLRQRHEVNEHHPEAIPGTTCSVEHLAIPVPLGHVHGQALKPTHVYLCIVGNKFVAMPGIAVSFSATLAFAAYIRPRLLPVTWCEHGIVILRRRDLMILCEKGLANIHYTDPFGDLVDAQGHAHSGTGRDKEKRPDGPHDSSLMPSIVATLSRSSHRMPEVARPS